MLHSKGKCIDLVIAISEDATASASNMNLLLSSKISCLYVHTYYTNCT